MHPKLNNMKSLEAICIHIKNIQAYYEVDAESCRDMISEIMYQPHLSDTPDVCEIHVHNWMQTYGRLIVFKAVELLYPKAGVA